MKVLIVSDSHGCTDELDMIRNRHEDVDMLIHCGDSELPNNHPSLKQFMTVRGNCDFDHKFPVEIVKDFGNNRFLITHGHHFNVKMSLMNLSYKAEEMGAKIVCFGHSHIAGAESINGIIFINPGSILLPKVRKEKTYAILEMDESKAKINFFDLNGKNIFPLTNQFSLH